MRIAHVLNMANNGYHMVKALRKNGVDADLIINSSDFGMSLPAWETEEIEEDPYTIPFQKIIAKYGIPPYVKIWYTPQPTKAKTTHQQRLPKWLRILKEYVKVHPFTVPDLYNIVKEYDVLHLHPPSPMFFLFLNKPKVIHESGWIRSLVTKNEITEKLGRRAYEQADSVVWTNPDTYPMLDHLRIKRLDFVPFVIDPEQYKPLKVEKTEDLLFFHPARQVWDVKGNDRLLVAFNKFIKVGYSAKLRLIDWGYEEDVQLAQNYLVKEGLEEYVEWHTPYSKPGLIRVYNECDVVFDQFLLGSGGTACYETMSCETPVVIHLNHWNEKCFGEMPPAVEASTVEEIYNSMIDLTDSKLRRKIGRAGRKFTLEHNHPDKIAKQLRSIYEEVGS